jgi:beta-phosphoglucomutase-like phosphatase (HAD superfamily)
VMIEVLLCDADGNLFPSEGPAFEASVGVTNRLMQAVGSTRRFDPIELRLATTGRNFRSTAAELVADAGGAMADSELEHWVALEKEAVTKHLAAALRPDHEVTGPLARLASELRLAAVSSSALTRLDACFEATGLSGLFPDGSRFSAEDSLPVPTSKPDPAIYLHALDQLGVEAGRAAAVEDAVPGVRSAVAAGVPTIGNLVFVAAAEREARADALLEAGALAVVSSWAEVEDALAPLLAAGAR